MAVTIYDVAKEAGVSIATVSKALNDSYTIPDQTKAAIREIADRLGYRPNARAKNFARQASGTVLFITDFYQNIAFENPHMFEIISGIATYLDGKDYSLTLKPLTKQAAPLYIRDIIQQRQADALIIHAFVLSPELAAILSRVDFPYLVNLRHVTGVQNDFVQIGQEQLEISRRQRVAFLAAVAAYVGGAL